MFFIFLIFEILPFIVVPIIIITFAVRAQKNKKDITNNSEDFKNTISNANDSNSYGNSISEESLDMYCAYCGSKFSKIKKSCPNCGAKTDVKQ